MLSMEVFSQGMLFLATIYDKLERITTDGAIAKLWYNSLKDLDDEAFKYAVETIAKTSKFAPSIAEIREKAWEYSHKEELTGEQAWEIVLRDVREKGWYREPKYENPILERAKNAITWEALCDISPEQLSILRRQFIDIYKSLMETQKYAEVANNGPKLKSLEELSKRLAQSKSFKQLGGGEDNGKK